jgi:hypothetical protein
MEKDILSPRQQIRLHFDCLVREHKLSKLRWHFQGIRRALFSLRSFADRNHPTLLYLSEAAPFPGAPVGDEGILRKLTCFAARARA